MSDLISRQDAIYAIEKRMDDITCEDFAEGMSEAITEISLLPSAQPKTGRWKPCKASIHPYGNDVKCSECDFTLGSSFGYKYCPMCGARMEGGNE